MLLGEVVPMVGDESAVGAVGVLSVATRGQAGPGEVVIPIRGGSEAFLAYSDEPLQRGTSVLVIATRGSRTVDVVAWSEPGLDPGRPREGLL